MTDQKTRQERKRRREELIAQRQREEQTEPGGQGRQGETAGRAGVKENERGQANKPRLPE